MYLPTWAQTLLHLGEMDEMCFLLEIAEPLDGKLARCVYVRDGRDELREKKREKYWFAIGDTCKRQSSIYITSSWLSGLVTRPQYVVTRSIPPTGVCRLHFRNMIFFSSVK